MLINPAPQTHSEGSHCPPRLRAGSAVLLALRAVLLAPVVAMLTHPALGQPSPIPSEVVLVSVDSGWRAAPADAAAHVPLFSHVITVDGAPWLRLQFREVELGGPPETGDATYIRVTSLEDGVMQTLDAKALKRWQDSSAYFNGDSVLVELLGYPGAGPRVS